MSNEHLVKLRGRVLGPSGRDRLSLYYMPCSDVQGGFDFHSLVWEREELGEWRAHRTITQQQFRARAARRRWVSELHSIDPRTGRAVVQVAEGNRPESLLRLLLIGAFRSSRRAPYSVTYKYSWRIWDLLSNTEIERLKDCETPHDRLD